MNPEKLKKLQAQAELVRIGGKGELQKSLKSIPKRIIHIENNFRLMFSFCELLR